jgi:hypothetical protein
VGWLIEQAGAELFIFASDFPHPEGGRDPIRRYTASLDEYAVREAGRERFFARNFVELVGARALAN